MKENESKQQEMKMHHFNGHSRKNALERQQIEKEKQKCKPTAKQPIKRKGRKTLKKNIISKENSSSEEDVTCVICCDSYLESKEDEDWIQCIVCKN